MSDKQTDPSFEDALNELDSIVGRMESGGRTLEESLDDFERGIKIVKICRKYLKDAELKVESLTNLEEANDTQAPE